MSDTNKIKHIVAKVKNGNTDAFRLLVEEYQHLAFTISYNIVKNRQDAEEVVQDSFIKVFNKIAQFKEESKFSSWLFKIVYNTSLSRIRKKQLDTFTLEHDDYSTEFGTESHNGWNQMVLNDQKKYIQIALDRLPEKDKIVLTLFYLADESLSDIAKITDEKQGAIKARLHRARTKVYDELNNLLQVELKELA